MTRQSDDLPVLVIDGARFCDFDGFIREFSRLPGNHTWHGNLDAFNGLAPRGLRDSRERMGLRWLNSELSRSALGYGETIQRLEQLLLTCHPSNRSGIEVRDSPRATQPGSALVRRHADRGMTGRFRRRLTQLRGRFRGNVERGGVSAASL
jgi:hypothetical protein